MSSRSITAILSLILLPIINSLELKLVQVICRHGDRAPLPDYQKWYPTDPHLNEQYRPAGFGELTEQGRNRSFAVGEFLRQRYFSALQMPPEYSSAFFKVRSSDVDRCKKSAEAMLTALFPSSKSTPIPISNKRLCKDPLFVGTYICRTARTEIDRSEKFMRRFENDEEWPFLHEYLSQHLGLNATRYHAFILHHTLMAQHAFGLSLPSWTNKIYPSEGLERTAAREYVRQSYSNKLKRINGGLWIREFLENMEKVASGKDAAKMLLYVGHETNIAGFLNALDIFELRVPSFCSFLSLEMYRDPESEEYYMKLFYRNYEKLEELRISGCTPLCSLKDFKILTKHLIPRNIKKECGLATYTCYT